MSKESSLGILDEIKRYMGIVELSKEAIYRNSKNMEMKDLVEKLTFQLEKCALTNGKGEKKFPLHDVLSYISDSEKISEELVKGQNFLNEILQQIEADVGPFYVPNEILKMTKIGDDIKLEDQVWIHTLDLLVVQTYFDEARAQFIQVDWRHGQYRTSLDNLNYGHWRFFTHYERNNDAA